MLKASFVRTVGQRDRIYVVRSDGSEVHWAFPTYGDALPHDLIHLVVEAAFGLAEGFWGRVDSGADPAAITAEADRRGGKDKYSGFGPDRSELLLAEALANPGWLVGEPSTASLREHIEAACRELGLATPELLSAERMDWVRQVLRQLACQWRGLRPKGALDLGFDAHDALGTCERLSKQAAVQPAGPLLSLAEHAVRTLNLPGSADFIVLDGDDAWVTNQGRVEKLTAASPKPVATVPIAAPCGAMAIDFGALWVVNCHDRTLVRVDLKSHQVSAVIPTGVADPDGELSVAAGGGSVWLLTDAAGVLSRVDPETNRVVARIPVQAHSFAAVFGFGSVWIAAASDGTQTGAVQRIDPRSNGVLATIPVGPGPRFLAAGAAGVWTLNQGDGTVSRVNPDTNRLAATIPTEVPGPGGDIAVGAGRVWVRATRTALSVIDPATNHITRRYGPPCGSGAVRANDRIVWVTAHDSQTVWALEP